MTRTNREEYTIFFYISRPICVGTRFRNFPCQIVGTRLRWYAVQNFGPNLRWYAVQEFPLAKFWGPGVFVTVKVWFSRSGLPHCAPLFKGLIFTLRKFCKKMLRSSENLCHSAPFTLIYSLENREFFAKFPKFWTPAALVRGSRISLSRWRV